MLFEELPKELKESVIETKHNSITINCELDDALQDAENYEQFKEMFRGKMLNLINEIRDAITNICGE